MSKILCLKYITLLEEHIETNSAQKQQELQLYRLHVKHNELKTGKCVCIL